MIEEFEDIAIFLDENAPNESMDFFMLYGFMTSLVVLGKNYESQKYDSVVFNEDLPLPEPSKLHWFHERMHFMYEKIERHLTNQDEDFSLGIDLDIPDESPELSECSLFCSGFMQAVFIEEENWDKAQTQDLTVEELIFPIVTLSYLYFDEEDFADVYNDDDLMLSFQSILEINIADLFDVFHKPSE